MPNYNKWTKYCIKKAIQKLKLKPLIIQIVTCSPHSIKIINNFIFAKIWRERERERERERGCECEFLLATSVALPSFTL